ncbi:MAG: hypothetical protein EBU90_29265, partial [Proteobacteria bacterium]|nr:hypothetical protein [Pseudomonadota bacterium]
GWKELEEFGATGTTYSRALEPASPDFIDKALAGVGSLLSFFISGTGIAKGAELLGMGVNGARSIGALGMSVLDSVSVAEETYQNAMSASGNTGLATNQAYKALIASLPATYLLDRFAFLEEAAPAIQRVLSRMGIEFVQEGPVQQTISNVFGYKPAGSGVTEAGLIGMVASGAHSASVSLADVLSNATPEEAAVINNVVNNASNANKANVFQGTVNDMKVVRTDLFNAINSDSGGSSLLNNLGIQSANDAKFDALIGGISNAIENIAKIESTSPNQIAANDPSINVSIWESLANAFSSISDNLNQTTGISPTTYFVPKADVFTTTDQVDTDQSKVVLPNVQSNVSTNVSPNVVTNVAQSNVQIDSTAANNANAVVSNIGNVVISNAATDVGNLTTSDTTNAVANLISNVVIGPSSNAAANVGDAASSDTTNAVLNLISNVVIGPFSNVSSNVSDNVAANVADNAAANVVIDPATNIAINVASNVASNVAPNVESNIAPVEPTTLVTPTTPVEPVKPTAPTTPVTP